MPDTFKPDTFESEWQKELRLLLGHIAAHPSHDLTAERARVVVLNKLLAEAEAQPA
ncbi:MAG: hypothetical protein QM676_14880 [Novosphingobium sp.]